MVADSKALPHTKKRRAFFWLWMTLLTLLALPALIFIGLLCYVSFGGLNGRITDTLSSTFKTPAQVGAVRTRWLQNLSIENVALTAPDGSKSLTVASVAVDWDLGDVLSHKHIRAVTLDRPELNLVRMRGEWSLGPPETMQPSEYTVGEVSVVGGAASVEWAPARKVRVQALNGSFFDRGPLGHSPFNLNGVFDSLEGFSLDGHFGPGAAWSARFNGAFDLDRDFGALLGPETNLRGHVSCDLSAYREGLLLDPNKGGPVPFNGHVALRDLHWPLLPGMALSVPEKSLSVHGVAKLGVDPDALVSLSELRISAEGLGVMTSKGSAPIKPGVHLRLDGAEGSIGMEPLNAMFSPLLCGESIRPRGLLFFSGVNMVLPVGRSAPPFLFSGDLSFQNAHVSISGLGELPPCDGAARIEWPALKTAAFKVGNIGTVTMNVRDLYPAGDYWPEFARGTTIDEITLDIGRFLESEAGRRLIGGVFDERKPAPLMASLPWVVGGTLRAKKLALPAEPSAKRTTTIAAPGVELSDLRIEKWPLPVNLPAAALNGTLDAVATLSGDVLQQISLTTRLSSGFRFGARLAAEASMTVSPGADGNWKIEPIKIAKLTLPMSDLEQLFDLKALSGVTGPGVLEVTGATIDPQSRDFSAKLNFTSPSLHVALPAIAQFAMVQALKSTDYASAAPVLEKYPIEEVELQKVAVSCDVTLKNGRLALRSHLQPCALKVSLAGVYEHTEHLPAAEIAYEFDLAAKDGNRSTLVEVSVKAADAFDVAARQTGADNWTLSASFDSKQASGVSGTLLLPVDLKSKQAGPAVFTAEDADLEILIPALAARGIEALKNMPAKGRVKSFKATLEAFPLYGLSADKLNGRIESEFSNVAIALPRVEFARMSGRLICPVNNSSRGIAMHPLLKLTDYEALIDGGIYIPPPAKDHGGSIDMVGVLEQKDAGDFIRLDRCDINLSDILRFSAAGTVALSGGSGPTIDLTEIKIDAPNTDEITRTFIAPNIANLSPWFGDFRLSGGVRFDGRMQWQPPGRAALSGAAKLNGCTLTLGKTDPFIIPDINGSLAVNLASGRKALSEEVRAAFKTGALQFQSTVGPIRTAAREIPVVARENSLAFAVPLELQTPIGKVTLAELEYKNIFAGQNSARAEPEIACTLAASIPLDELLRQNGIAIKGLEGAKLECQGLACRLRKTSGKLGSAWNLESGGEFRAPFFGGEIVVEKISARNVFSGSPVFVCDMRIEARDGIKLGQLTAKNSQFGGFNVHSNMLIEGLAMNAPSLAGIQKFTFTMRSVDEKPDVHFFDGVFAMKVNYGLVRAAFPRLLFSDEKISKLTFGVQKLGLSYELQSNGMLRGPIPLLPHGLIVEGYGAESNPFSKRFKKDIAGDGGHYEKWSDLIAGLHGFVHAK